ncbi:MAG: TldD/PmbA family protein [Planctomycetota bacterium]
MNLDDIVKPFHGTLPPETELRAHINHSSTQVMRRGRLLVNDISRIGGVNCRIRAGEAFALSSAPDLSREGATRVLSEARSNAALLASHSASTPIPPAPPGITCRHNFRTGKKLLTTGERLAFIKALDAHLESRHSDLVSWDVSLSSLALEKALVTTAGTFSYSYVPRSTLNIKLSVKAPGGDLVELYELLGGFGDPEEHFTDPSSYLESIERLRSELDAKAAGIQARPGVHDVILDSAVAGILAHEAVGHTVEADLVLGGSIAGDNVGKKVADERITLVDDPGRGPDGKSSIEIHVDDEGVPCRKTTLIEKGILKGFLHNRETARRFGVEPTGNARAWAFYDEPLVRMRSTAILPGQSLVADMIASVEDGYYLVRSSNGQADSTSEFMFGVTLGYEIKNGKLGKALRDTTISGVAFDMLQSVTAVSQDMRWSAGGMCGKKQVIPVGMGGPAIKCRLRIGGR